jgi:hypothetical protein
MLTEFIQFVASYLLCQKEVIEDLRIKKR